MKTKILKMLLFLWQLPQNLVGIVAVMMLKAEKESNGFYYHKTKGFSSVSLGNYVIIRRPCSDEQFTIMHESGHQVQSLYLGWLYLIVIGLPSAIGNLVHRKIRFNYYAQPWERWANSLGYDRMHNDVYNFIRKMEEQSYKGE